MKIIYGFYLYIFSHAENPINFAEANVMNDSSNKRKGQLMISGHTSPADDKVDPSLFIDLILYKILFIDKEFERYKSLLFLH